MPAIINVAANVIFGSVLAWIMRDHPLLKREQIGWPLVWLAAFQAVIFTPIAAYLFQFYPHWSMLYAVDPYVHPWWEDWRGTWSAIAVIANAVGACGAYGISWYGLAISRRWLVWMPAGLGSLIILSVLIGYGRRVLTITDYDHFWAGHGINLFTSVPGWIGICLYAGTSAGLVFIARWSKRSADAAAAAATPSPMAYTETSVTQITRIMRPQDVHGAPR